MRRMAEPSVFLRKVFSSQENKLTNWLEFKLCRGLKSGFSVVLAKRFQGHMS